jgi:hypothetical protein
MHPEILTPSRESFPLQEGEIEPRHRAVAMRKLLATPLDYPHCQLCHRAMLAREQGGFMCPNGHMTYEAEKPIAWWRKWLVRAEAR